LTRLRVGTRGSALALAQAQAVASRLAEPAELVTVTTAGDVDRAAGDKSRWTGALEAALLRGEIDLAVHSAKDVPGELAEGCALVAAPRRAAAHDVLVGAPLGPGIRVGTSALRRRAQLLADRPDLDVVDLRGNVDTRLRKLAAGEVDALVLAAAGLERLDREEPRTPLDHVPAPGQGVLAIEARAGDERARSAVAAVHDAGTWACLMAERAAVAVLGASCHTPVGVHASHGDAGLHIRGFAGLPDGSEWVFDELVSDAGTPEEAGRELAERMLAAGAGDLLARAEALAP
jgi:hydroxymethylbilane synthase